MIRIFCDKCGLEIKGNPVKATLKGPQLDQEYEICDRCARGILEEIDK